MKIYERPELEVSIFEVNEIITGISEGDNDVTAPLPPLPPTETTTSEEWTGYH